MNFKEQCINEYERICEERNLSPSRRDKVVIEVLSKNIIEYLGQNINKWIIDELMKGLEGWIFNEAFPGFENYIKEKYNLPEIS